MNINVPNKETRTDVTPLGRVGKYKRPRDQGDKTRSAILTILSLRPGSAVRELCAETGKAPSTIHFQLNKLENEGKIVKEVCPLCRGRMWRVT
jgi:DNA-binding transcriptional ArsR family regulator